MFGWDKKLRKKLARIVMFVLAVLFSLPLEWGLLQGAFLWLSPYVAVNRLLATHGLLIFHGLSAIVLFFCLRNHRWFCQSLCPVGWCCSQLSSFANHRKLKLRGMKMGEWLVWLTIGLSLAGIPFLLVLDPLVIFRAFFSGLLLPFSALTCVWCVCFLVILVSNVYVPFFWCEHLCPLGGFQDLTFKARKQPSHLFSRRNVILLLGSWCTGFYFSRNLKATKPSAFLPPSARRDARFYTTCLRCGNCVSACPASIIHLNTSGSFISWQTPELDFSRGYCWSDCVNCGQVCPSGALPSFTREDKRRLVIGRAKVNTEICLLTRNKECDRCRSVCAYDAILCKPQHLLMRIEINNERCVGCNACAVICPERAISIEKV